MTFLGQRLQHGAAVEKTLRNQEIVGLNLEVQKKTTLSFYLSKNESQRRSNTISKTMDVWRCNLTRNKPDIHIIVDFPYKTKLTRTGLNRIPYHRKTRTIRSSGSFPSGMDKKMSGCAKKSEYISRSDRRSRMKVGRTILVKSIPIRT